MISHQKLIIIVLCLVVTATGLLSLRQRDHDSGVTSSAQQLPDLIIENAIHTQMDEEGIPKLKMRVASIIHYGKNNSSHMIQPHLMTTNQKENWEVQSEYGKTTGKKTSEKVVLRDNVIVRMLGKAGESTSTLKTSELIIWPGKLIAETEQPVTIERGPNVINATGLVADLKLKQMKLLSEVKGHYEAENEKRSESSSTPQ